MAYIMTKIRHSMRDDHPDHPIEGGHSQAQRQLSHLIEEVSLALDMLSKVPAETGVCMCGSPMHGHPHDNHTKIDQWDHILATTVKRLQPLLTLPPDEETQQSEHQHKDSHGRT